MNGWKRGIPVALAVAVLAGACSGGGSKKASTPSTSVGSVGATVTATGPAPSGAVLATTKSAVGDKSAQVDVLALQRAGDHVTLRIAVTNVSDSCCVHFDAFTDPDQAKKDAESLSGAYLVDDVGAKKYFPLRDAEGNCLCSSHLESLSPGNRIELSATFPAPPRSVKVVTVSFSQFPAFPNIPISG